METTYLIIIAVAVVLVLLLVSLASKAAAARRRTKQLQERFGPEYDHAIQEFGDRTQAEQILEERIAHVHDLHIHPLTAEQVNRYALEWQEIQREFVDEPLTALKRADYLIEEVMNEKGYPKNNFEQRASDISVIYPELVNDYRGMHRIVSTGKGSKPDTEELRQAMLHGRALFENLIKEESRDVVEIQEKERV